MNFNIVDITASQGVQRKKCVLLFYYNISTADKHTKQLRLTIWTYLRYLDAVIIDFT